MTANPDVEMLVMFLSEKKNHYMIYSRNDEYVLSLVGSMFIVKLL